MAEPIAATNTDPSPAAPTTPATPVSAPNAPAQTAAPVAPATPAPVPAADTKPHTKTDDLPPEALAKRLESERKSLLTKLGFESEEQAKAAATELAAKREAEKTAETKAAEAKTAREAAEKRAQDIEARAKVWADAELSKLTPEQKAAVEALAGQDPVRVFDTITALRPTWSTPAVTAASSQTAATATQPAAASPTPAAPAPTGTATTTQPASTAPAPGVPAPGTGNPPDVKALAAEAWKTNPFKFAQIVTENLAAFSTKTYQ